MRDEAGVRNPVLPDLLRPGLRIVFCGTAAGTVSAARGAYYAHPQNRFWSALHAVRIDAKTFAAGGIRPVAAMGLGAHRHRQARERHGPGIAAGRLGPPGLRGAQGQIEAAEPKWLAFTSLAAGRRYLGRPPASANSPSALAEPAVWLLPSPSPTAGWNWDRHKHWWRTLADEASGTNWPPAPRRNVIPANVNER